MQREILYIIQESFSLTQVYFWSSKLNKQMPHYDISMKAVNFSDT